MNKFISCDNKRIVFILNGEQKIFSREYVERELGVYWFAADLYNLIIKKIL